jgi:hypothetical protein
MNAQKALPELYQLTWTAPALTVQLPSELGVLIGAGKEMMEVYYEKAGIQNRVRWI